MAATTIEDLHDELRELSRVLTDHIRDENEVRLQAFPNGDIAAHRIAHEQMIRTADAEAKFWAELRLDVAKKGTWFLLATLFGLAAVGGVSWLISKLHAAGVP